jgi:hypothetical protein
MKFVPIVEVVELIQMEYAELPDLRLTFWQARRLWNLSEELCERALRDLVASGFLAQTPDGSYVRGSSSPADAERAASLVRQRQGAIT